VIKNVVVGLNLKTDISFASPCRPLAFYSDKLEHATVDFFKQIVSKFKITPLTPTHWDH